MNTNTTSGAADLPEARLFTKKPVTIAAIQWFKNGDHPQVRAIAPSDDLFFTGVGGATLTDREKYGVIGTLESPNHLVTPGDWIITGVAGEHYACKPDIFEATYSPAALAAGQATAAQGVAYAALPTSSHAGSFLIGTCPLYTADQMRAFADATHTLRASHGQAPATQQAGIPGNFITHRAAWREALETAKFVSTGVDRSYWDHELAAFDRSFDRLWALMQDAPHTSPTTQAADGVTAPAPPPECETEAEKRAFAFGWFKALKFYARRDKKATVTLLFPGHEAADAWVRGIKGGQHGTE